MTVLRLKRYTTKRKKKGKSTTLKRCKRRKKCKYTIFQLHHNHYKHLDNPNIPEDKNPVRMKFHYVLTIMRRFKAISKDEKKAVRYVLKHWPTYRLTKQDKATIKRLYERRKKK